MLQLNKNKEGVGLSLIHIFLSYMDTCTIFANALDNAVTACSHVDTGGRRIDLTVKKKKDMLSIIIENSKQNEIVEKENRLFSTKPNKEQHGFGVENIKMAVSKYHGLVSIEHTKDKFIFSNGITNSGLGFKKHVII